MSHREQVIVELLERYNDLSDPVRAGNGDGITGVLRMPPTYDASVRELERLLVTMRDDRHRPLLVLPSGEKASVRSCWWHVNQRYLEAVTVMRTLVWRRGRWAGLNGHAAVVAQPGGWELALAAERSKKRRDATQQLRVKVAVWDPQVSPARVARGVGWLADEWGLVHEPMLPRELMVA